MPLYNIEHSYPLKLQEKQDLADRITKLHGAAFNTLSMFVQVKFFQQDASASNHYVGGIPQSNASNRIISLVRTGSGRKQEDFDKLAKQIEDAWYIVLGLKYEDEEDEEKAKKNNDKGPSEVEKNAKELLSIVFIGGVNGREKGFPIPVAGQDKEWFEQNRAEFEKRSDLGDETFVGLFKEIDLRDDLKSWRSEDSKAGKKEEKKEDKEEKKEGGES